MDRPSREQSIWDAENFFRQWCRTNPLYDELFCSAINRMPYTEAGNSLEITPAMAYIVWIGNFIRAGERVNRDAAYTCMMADMMGPCMASNKIMLEDEARVRFISSINALLNEPDQLGIITELPKVQLMALPTRTREIYQDIGYNAPVDENGVAVNNPPLPPLVTTIDEALMWNFIIAHNSNRGYRPGGLSILINCLLAVIKRGTMSAQFAEKIRNGVEADLNTQGIDIRSDVCSRFYNNYSTGITSITIGAIVERWLGYLPVSALRLRLTLEQATGSGLTSITVIGKAIRLYERFPWTRVAAMFQAEMVNVNNAIRTIGDNQWYGYNHDLGVVKSTNYKNISYIAKELLIRLNGEGGLEVVQ